MVLGNLLLLEDCTMVDVNIFWQNIEDLATISDPNMPYTRRSFSSYFLQGRAFLTTKMREYGLETFIDPNGNLIGFKKGQTQKTIVVGSHSDTVDGGGKYDGVAGVCAGLEIARAVQNTELRHNLCIIDYLAEEPSEWGISCIGSRALSSHLTHKDLQLTFKGETLSDAIRRVGGSGESVHFNRLNLGELCASFELHIEQGRVLEEKQCDIGIVSSIVGILRLRIVFKGQSNHAGTTPFYLRDDAFLKACEFSLFAHKKAKQLSQQTYFVSTIGKIATSPNASNIICSHCEIILDIRSDQDQYIEQYRNVLKHKSEQMHAYFHEISFNAATLCDMNLIELLRYNARRLNFESMIMPSGAGHDSAFMAKIAPACMVFVPSKNGISHSKDEFTSKRSFEKALQLLYHSILQKDLE